MNRFILYGLKQSNLILVSFLTTIFIGCAVEQIKEISTLSVTPENQSFQIRSNDLIQVSVDYSTNTDFFFTDKKHNARLIEKDLLLALRKELKTDGVKNAEEIEKRFPGITPNYLINAKIELLGSDSDSGFKFILSVITLFFYPYNVTEHYICKVELKNTSSGKVIQAMRSYDVNTEHIGPLPSGGNWTANAAEMTTAIIVKILQPAMSGT
jgi:hypothetical protein